MRRKRRELPRPENRNQRRVGIRLDQASADSIMQRLDVLLFDIQDVGLRYYTYLSSMHYLMEACAANASS